MDDFSYDTSEQTDSRALTRGQAAINDGTLQATDFYLSADRVDVIFAEAHNAVARLQVI